MGTLNGIFILAKNSIKNWAIAVLTISFVLVWGTSLTWAQTASAEAEVVNVSATTESATVDDAKASAFPYNKAFVVSAYYSPLPGQAHYATGSYEGDIRLNGGGVRGASGAPVNIHMIAAPPSFAFGTKITCPGIGTGVVQDRGGAIKGSRLDKWMGYGDVGLKRALQYGKRSANCIVHGIDDSIPVVSYIDGYSEAEKFIQGVITTPTVFVDDLFSDSQGGEVKLLQEHLKELGYYHDAINAEYGEATRKAVFKFQKDFGIVDDESELGAGNFGPQTRMKLEAILQKKDKDLLPAKKLQKGDKGADVTKLQNSLLKLGYDVEVTGVYDDKTADAVLSFQLDLELIESGDDLAAGYFGEKTLLALGKSITTQSFLDEEVAKLVPVNTEALLAKDLKLGDSGPDVYRLQEELKKLNYLWVEPNGYFGQTTENAVYKFQQATYLAADRNSPGAGVFGPITKEKLNGYIAGRVESRNLVAKKSGGETSTLLAFHGDLAIGDTNKDVQELQKALQKLGYFEHEYITDYFGEVTKNAVLAFQKDYKLVASATETGAGVFGPATRAELSKVLYSQL